MGVTPVELDDALDDALAGTRWWQRRRAVIWMTSRDVVIPGVGRWVAVYASRHGYGFTRAQAAQIRRALRPVLAAYGPALETLILELVDGEAA